MKSYLIFKCLWNTEGDHCEKCKPGFFGDPIAHEAEQGWKGCQDCQCNEEGTIPDSVCNAQTGTCPRKTGVTGKKCDECEPEHYGFGIYEDGCQ